MDERLGAISGDVTGYLVAQPAHGGSRSHVRLAWDGTHRTAAALTAAAGEKADAAATRRARTENCMVAIRSRVRARSRPPSTQDSISTLHSIHTFLAGGSPSVRRASLLGTRRFRLLAATTPTGRPRIKKLWSPATSCLSLHSQPPGLRSCCRALLPVVPGLRCGLRDLIIPIGPPLLSLTRTSSAALAPQLRAHCR